MKRSFHLIFLLLLAAFNTLAQLPSADRIPASKGQVIVSPVQHASVNLNWNKLTICVDPTGGAEKYKGVVPDLILVTDIHGDHFEPKTLVALKKAATILIVPQAVADILPAEVSKDHLIILKNGEKTKQAGISIKAIPMYNLPESPTARHIKGRGNGYILTLGGKNIYFSGDTQGIPEMLGLKKIDAAFVCMNLPYTMDVQEAARAVLVFKPKIVYPYHHRGQDIAVFKQLVNTGNKAIDVRLLNWYP